MSDFAEVAKCDIFCNESKTTHEKNLYFWQYGKMLTVLQLEAKCTGLKFDHF